MVCATCPLACSLLPCFRCDRTVLCWLGSLVRSCLLSAGLPRQVQDKGRRSMSQQDSPIIRWLRGRPSQLKEAPAILLSCQTRGARQWGQLETNIRAEDEVSAIQETGSGSQRATGHPQLRWPCTSVATFCVGGAIFFTWFAQVAWLGPILPLVFAQPSMTPTTMPTKSAPTAPLPPATTPAALTAATTTPAISATRVSPPPATTRAAPLTVVDLAIKLPVLPPPPDANPQAEDGGVMSGLRFVGRNPAIENRCMRASLRKPLGALRDLRGLPESYTLPMSSGSQSRSCASRQHV